MDSLQDTAALPAVGFPIRTSTDQSLVGGSPWLIAATHVLRRLLEPRHPPHALSSLVTLNSGLPSECSSGACVRGRDPDLRSRGSHEDLAVRCSYYPSYSVVRVLRRGMLRRAPGHEFPTCSGGADRSRTDDIQLAKLALYQLSYSPTSASSVGIGGPRWI
jgi:hypothetical protein